MSIWERLGIDPTTDKDRIKQAYRRKLALYHPEDDPDGFQALRAAYESALQYREEESDGSRELSEVDIWIQEVDRVYQDFAARIQPESWNRLLDADIVCALDTEREAHFALLRYLMGHHHLPHTVFKILGDFFRWEETKAELSESFQPEFINYICNNAKYETGLRYEEFQIEEGRDYESFIKNYLDLYHSDFKADPEQSGRLLKEMQDLEIIHPDFLILFIRFFTFQEDYEAAEGVAETLRERWPEDVETLYCLGRLAQGEGKAEEAQNYMFQILTKNPEHMGAIMALGDMCFQAKCFDEAIEFYKRVQEQYPYDRYVNHYLILSYQELAGTMLEEMADDENNDDLKFKYLEVAVKGYQMQQAHDVGLTIRGEQAQTYDYHIWMAKAEEVLGEYEQALISYGKALDMVREDTHKSAEILADCGLVCLQMDKPDQALAYYEEGMGLDFECEKLYYRKAAVLIKQGNYPEAVELCNRAIVIKDVPNTYHFRADALYHMQEYEAALADCDYAIRTAGYIDTYIIKLNIFFETKRFTELYQTCQIVENMGAFHSGALIIKVKALLDEQKMQEADEILKVVLEKEPDNKEALYQKAVYEWYLKDYVKAYQYVCEAEKEDAPDSHRLFKADILAKLNRDQEADKIYDELLKTADLDQETTIHCRKGDLYKQSGKSTEAIRQYEQVLELHPDHQYACGELGEMYWFLREYGNAIKYYTWQIARVPYAYAYIIRAFSYEEIHDKKSAEADYQRLAEQFPRYEFGFYHYAKLLIAEGRLEPVTELMRQAVTLGIERKDALPLMAHTLLRLKKYDEAMQTYAQIEDRIKAADSNEYKPEDYEFLKEKFYIFCLQSKYQQAKETVVTYLEKTEDTKWGYTALAECYAKQGEYDKAVNCYKEGVRLHYKNSLILVKFGKFWREEMKNPRKAKACFDKAVKYKATDHDAWMELAETYKELGNEKKVIECCQKVLMLIGQENTAPCACYDMAHAYYLLAQYDQAENYAKQAVQSGATHMGCYHYGCQEAIDLLEKIGEKKKERRPESKEQKVVKRYSLKSLIDIKGIKK